MKIKCSRCKKQLQVETSFFYCDKSYCAFCMLCKLSDDGQIDIIKLGGSIK